MTPSRIRFSFLVAFLSLVASVFASPAFAARSVKAEKTVLEEDTEARNWRLKLVIDYGGKPDRDVVSMVFSFKQTATYERALTDESPEKPVTRTVPMPDQIPTNYEQEVSFSEPGTGKRFNMTKFPITLRRKDDFEAGEYELTVKVVGGASLGTVRLQLKGENKPIDRRSLNFSASVAAPKKKAAASDSAGEKKGAAAEDQGLDLSGIPEVAKDDEKPANAPPPVPPRQGGCGCEIAGAPSSRLGSVAALLAVGLVVARRSRRRSQA